MVEHVLDRQTAYTLAGHALVNDTRPGEPAALPGASPSGAPHLGTPSRFADLPGFDADDLTEAFKVFLASCRSIVTAEPVLRQGAETPPLLKALCRKALAAAVMSPSAARAFFETHFEPRSVSLEGNVQGSGKGFVTGYYEPVVEGALDKSDAFSAPVLALPESFEGPYPDRAAIDAGALGDKARPIVYLKDPVEVFFVHVQGSARVRLRDGSELRLTYAGRNGLPYTSIGRLLVEEHGVPPEQADMTGLKAWIRARGQQRGEPGLALMQRNKSFIFFKANALLDPALGPIGGQGLPLTAFRSLAIDRAIWPYGLPFWIEAEIPWQSETPSPFRRLVIGQDTGSAIIGPARGDIFFGAGSEAGIRAGRIRHAATISVLWPKAAASP